VEVHDLPHFSRASSSDTPQRGDLLATRDPPEVGFEVDGEVMTAVGFVVGALVGTAVAGDDVIAGVGDGVASDG